MTGYKSICAVLCCVLIFAAATATGVYAAPDTDTVHHSNLKYTATGAHSVDENSKTGSTGVAGLVGWFKTLHHKIVGEKVSVNLFGKSGGTGVGNGILKSVSKNEVVVGLEPTPDSEGTGGTGPAFGDDSTGATGATGATAPTGSTGLTGYTGATSISGLEGVPGISRPCDKKEDPPRNLMQDVDDPKIVGLGSRVYSIISHLKFLNERVAYSINRNDELLAFKKKSCLKKAKAFDEEQSHFTSLVNKNILKEQELHKRAQNQAGDYNADLPIVEEMTKAYREAKVGHALTVNHLKNELKVMQLALKKLKLAKSAIVSSKTQAPLATSAIFTLRNLGSSSRKPEQNGAATQLLEVAASKSNIRSKLHDADDNDEYGRRI